MPKISIIIPVYGVEQYIERCAVSLFEQTIEDIEYIFIDDCTQDNSIEILKEVIEEYKSKLLDENKLVRIEKMLTNSGQATVRQHGIQLSKGDFIIHCDSDDWVEKDAYLRMWEKAIEEDLDVVVCNYVRTNGIQSWPSNNSIDILDSLDNRRALSLLLQSKIPTSVWSKLVKADLYKDTRLQYPEHNMWEDYLLSTQILFFSKRIGFIEKPYYHYFANPNSICNVNIEKRHKQLVANCNAIIHFLNSNDLTDNFSEEIICLKVLARTELDPYLLKRKYFNLWKNTYPEIDKVVMSNHLLSFMDKFKFVTKKLRIFPLLSVINPARI